MKDRRQRQAERERERLEEEYMETVNQKRRLKVLEEKEKPKIKKGDIENGR